jgi:hypothetical protein
MDSGTNRTMIVGCQERNNLANPEKVEQCRDAWP